VGDSLVLSWHIHVLVLEVARLLGVSLVWLLNVNVLCDVLVKLIEFAHFWSQHCFNVLFLVFVIVIIDRIVVVEEIVRGVRAYLLLVPSSLLVEAELWDLLEASSTLFIGLLLIAHSKNVLLVF
jgi:hypothetical protein